MEPGKYTIYSIQNRQTFHSPWLKPNGKLVPCDDKEWSDCGEFFWKGLYPRLPSKTGGIGKPKFPKAQAEIDEIHYKMGFGFYSWYTIQYAMKALNRLRKLDAQGEFNSHGYGENYDKETQAVRHEFRIVKEEWSFDVQPVTMEDVFAVAGN